MALMCLVLVLGGGCQLIQQFLPAPMPAEVINRAELPSCGSEDRGQGDPGNAEARECLLTAFEQGEPAEFISTRLTIEGDPLAIIYRVWPTDDASPVVLYIDSTRDQFGSGRWERLRCQEIRRAEFDLEWTGCADGERL